MYGFGDRRERGGRTIPKENAGGDYKHTHMMTSHLKAPYSHSVVNESSVYLILQGCRIFPRLEIPKNRLAAPPSLFLRCLQPRAMHNAALPAR